jgi:hypothetical protein
MFIVVSSRAKRGDAKFERKNKSSAIWRFNLNVGLQHSSDESARDVRMLSHVISQ